MSLPHPRSLFRFELRALRSLRRRPLSSPSRSPRASSPSHPLHGLRPLHPAAFVPRFVPSSSPSSSLQRPRPPRPLRPLRPLRGSLLVAGVLLAACSPVSGKPLGARERAAVADAVRRTIVAACDLSQGDVVQRLMSLYPDTGRVISASGGAVTTTRSELERSIRAFWTTTGQNMRNPRWEWRSMHIDVLAPDAAVLTATYRIPHLTPRGTPHVIGGAWTAVFQRRGARWVIIQEHLSDAPPIG